MQWLNQFMAAATIKMPQPLPFASIGEDKARDSMMPGIIKTLHKILNGLPM